MSKTFKFKQYAKCLLMKKKKKRKPIEEGSTYKRKLFSMCTYATKKKVVVEMKNVR